MSAFVFLETLTCVVSLSLGEASSLGRLDNLCHVECVAEDRCNGPGPEHCRRCRHFFNTSSLACVETCQDQVCVVCHQQCVEGCRGASASECRHCKHYYDISRRECVETCDLETHFMTQSVEWKFECRPCHEECDGSCEGPLAKDCILGCKHYYHVESRECVQNCVVGTNLTNRECVVCHKECKRGCTGPSAGECRQCKHFSNEKSQQCVKTCDPESEFATQYNSCEACHEECAGGCNGPSASECHKCKNSYSTSSHECVERCNYRVHYETEDKECKFCHGECENGCDGPTDKDCYACRNKQREDRCVSECEDNEYDKYGECERCHADCLLACSGPLDTTGKGGCNPCPKPVFERSSTYTKPCYDFQSICYYVDSCLELDDPCRDGHFGKRLPLVLNGSELMPRFPDKQVCIPCHELCSKCTSYGFNPGVCQECPRHPNCSCLPGTYFHQDIDNCKPCKAECKECSNGDTCRACGGEYKYRVYDEGYPSANGSFTCMKKCPPYQRFSNFSEMYQDHCTSVNSTRNITLTSQQTDSKDTGITMPSAIILVVVVQVVLFCGLIYYLNARNKSNKSVSQMEHNRIAEDLEEPQESSYIEPNRNKLRIIAENDVIKIEILGSGAFGEVYRGFLLREGCNARDPVAIKVLNPQNKDTSTKEFLKEASIMGRVHHVNLLPLLAICVTSNVMLVTELMPLGDLLHYLHKHNKSIKPKTMVNWCLQIAEGMDYLEKHSLVHRDLAARNVLLQTRSRLKVTDFGLARAVNKDQGMYESRGGKLPVKWMALESLKTCVFTHKTDVWSFGVTVWEILTCGEEPYTKCPTFFMLRSTLEAGRRLGQPDSCSSDLYTVLATCWAEDASSRPSFQELVDTFSMMSEDPDQFINELVEGRNQIAPALLPRKFYHAISEIKPFSRSYENVSKETHSPTNSRAISDVHEPKDTVPDYVSLQSSDEELEG